MASRFSRLTALGSALVLLGVLAPTANAQVVDDFTDGDFTADPAWSGSTASFSVATDPTLPSGTAATDGFFLASNASAGSESLVTASTQTSEWRFSLGSGTFNPSAANRFGVVLMSSAALAGNVESVTWDGYYLNIGRNLGGDQIDLFRRSGTTSTQVGAFAASPSFDPGAAAGGVNIRVTRSAAGVFELFTSTGFLYSAVPTTSAGTLTDATFSTSAFFGVYTIFSSPSAARRVYLDNVVLGAVAAAPTTVQFASASATAAEDNGIVGYDVTISNPSATAATTFDVALTGGTGTAADIGNFTTQSFTFDAGGSAAQQLVIEITDDMDVDPGETFEFTIQNVAGGNGASASTPSVFTLTIADNEVAPALQLVITEFMKDPVAVSDNNGEYFEVFNAGSTAVDLNGITISDDGSNRHTIASSVVVQPGAFAVLCNDATMATNGGFTCDYEYAGITLANGDDEIILTAADGTTEIDRVAYDDGAQWPDPAGAAAVFTGAASDDNNVGANWTTATLREPSYTGTAGDLGSPGTRGSDQTIGLAIETVTQDLADGVAGYRLLSTPVTGVTVDDLAAVNLVQGIPASGGFEAQYVNAVPNVYTSYDGATYGAPTGTGAEVLPGRGFFWQFYDMNIDSGDVPASFGSGTSDSFTLDRTPDLTATGPAITTTIARAFAASADEFYMIGNPFARALDAAAITETSGVGRQTILQAYQPAAMGGTYVPIEAGSARSALAVWQGVFAEASGTGAPTFRFDADVAVPATAAFVGRSATAPGVALSLAGTTAAGAATQDVAAVVRFAEGASAGWDAGDASKMTPPAGPFALLAPVMTRDGAPYRTAVNTLPLAGATVPLAFRATDAGTYTLDAAVAGLPEGVTAELRDVVTGTVSDLSEGYTFTSDATDWTTRFELVLTQRGATAGESGPAVLALGNPAPNPTTRQSTMTLTVDAAQRVTATVVDALGRTVATVLDADLAAGAEARIVVDASRLAPGVYVVRVAGETFAEARRITVAR